MGVVLGRIKKVDQLPFEQVFIKALPGLAKIPEDGADKTTKVLPTDLKTKKKKKMESTNDVLIPIGPVGANTTPQN
jgi:hypothetical protein